MIGAIKFLFFTSFIILLLHIVKSEAKPKVILESTGTNVYTFFFSLTNTSSKAIQKLKSEVASNLTNFPECSSETEEDTCIYLYTNENYIPEGDIPRYYIDVFSFVVSNINKTSFPKKLRDKVADELEQVEDFDVILPEIEYTTLINISHVLLNIQIKENSHHLPGDGNLIDRIRGTIETELKTFKDITYAPTSTQPTKSFPLVTFMSSAATTEEETEWNEFISGFVDEMNTKWKSKTVKVAKLKFNKVPGDNIYLKSRYFDTAAIIALFIVMLLVVLLVK